MALNSSTYSGLGLALAKLCLSLERIDINTEIYCLYTLYPRAPTTLSPLCCFRLGT
jgi:hypothetical protein